MTRLDGADGLGGFFAGKYYYREKRCYACDERKASERVPITKVTEHVLFPNHQQEQAAPLRRFPLLHEISTVHDIECFANLLPK